MPGSHVPQLVTWMSDILPATIFRGIAFHSRWFCRVLLTNLCLLSCENEDHELYHDVSTAFIGRGVFVSWSRGSACWSFVPRLVVHQFLLAATIFLWQLRRAKLDELGIGNTWNDVVSRMWSSSPALHLNPNMGLWTFRKEYHMFVRCNCCIQAGSVLLDITVSLSPWVYERWI